MCKAAMARLPTARSLAAPTVSRHPTTCPHCLSWARQAPSLWPRGKQCRIWRHATNCIAMATRHRGLISPRIQPGSRLTSEQPQSRLRAGRARRAAGQQSPLCPRPQPGRVPHSGAPASGHPGRARLGSVVPGGSPGCRRRPGAPGGAAGGWRSAATTLSPPSTPRTASCPQPLREEPGRHQHLHPPGSPLSPPPQGSSFLPSLRPGTTHCSATPEQPGAAAQVTHARATLPPVSAVTHGPSLAPGTGRPSRLGGCFWRGGGSWTRLEGTDWARHWVHGGRRRWAMLWWLVLPPPSPTTPCSVPHLWGRRERNKKPGRGDKRIRMCPPLQQPDLLALAPQTDGSLPPQALTPKHRGPGRAPCHCGPQAKPAPKGPGQGVPKETHSLCTKVGSADVNWL